MSSDAISQKKHHHPFSSIEFFEHASGPPFWALRDAAFGWGSQVLFLVAPAAGSTSWW